VAVGGEPEGDHRDALVAEAEHVLGDAAGACSIVDADEGGAGQPGLVHHHGGQAAGDHRLDAGRVAGHRVHQEAVHHRAAHGTGLRADLTFTRLSASTRQKRRQRQPEDR
jgi:hypothetical protein